MNTQPEKTRDDLIGEIRALRMRLSDLEREGEKHRKEMKKLAEAEKRLIENITAREGEMARTAMLFREASLKPVRGRARA